MCKCRNSSAPHLSSLTVGEWSPEGFGGKLPPVRETDRLKPRQPGEGVMTTVVPPVEWARGELSCLFEREPEGQQGKAVRPKAREENQLFTGQGGGRQVLAVRGLSYLGQTTRLPQSEEQVGKREKGVGGIWELGGEGTRGCCQGDQGQHTEPFIIPKSAVCTAATVEPQAWAVGF